MGGDGRKRKATDRGNKGEGDKKGERGGDREEK